MDSAGFVPDDHWGELKSRLLDIQDRRLRLMDSHGVERMILSLNAPAVQAIPDSCRANEVARRANDILAREVSKRPDRFSAFAALPMQDPDLASRELERCVAQLGFKGALVNGFTQAGNENTTLYYDLPQYWPFWQLVSSRCAVLSAPAQSLAGPCADLRWAPLAAGPDLGVRTGNSGPRAAAHGLGPVRCLSAPDDRPRPYGGGPALQHVAGRQPQCLGQGATAPQGKEEDRRLFPCQLLSHHLGEFPHPDPDRRHPGDRRRPHPGSRSIGPSKTSITPPIGSMPRASARTTGSRSGA